MIWVILLPSTVRGEFSRNAPAKLQVGYRCISLAELSKQFLAFSSTHSYHVFLVFQFVLGAKAERMSLRMKLTTLCRNSAIRFTGSLQQVAQNISGIQSWS